MTNPAGGLHIARAPGKDGGLPLDSFLLLRMANRHGLVTGATGTGKTVTLQTIAEAFSRAGVPVFAADVKGDLSGISQAGAPKPRIEERIKQLGLGDFPWQGTPVTFWDVFGEQGHPVRATVSEMGPLLFARLLDLNETQTGVLTIIFKIADDQGMLLLDLKDLRAVTQYVGDNAKEFRTEYGNITAASVGAIQRQLLALEEQGAAKFFGEPALDLDDMIQTIGGRGIVNLLAADKLMMNPKTYATLLLWLLSELFERLPEAGDLDKPKLVFFFDEAHLLFDDAPEALLDKIEQVVRLIRSRGIGVYFVTQNPLDVPVKVLGQLGNRVQHALRAFTPLDQKAVKTAAETFRANPALDTEKVITELGVGEALVSFLDEKGVPGMVERVLILPPHSQIGAIAPEERKAVMDESLVKGVYDTPVDNVSAYEMLKKTVEERQAAALAAQEAAAQAKAAADAAKQEQKERERAQKEAERTAKVAERERIKDEKEAAREREKDAREAQRLREKEAKEAQREHERQLKEMDREHERRMKEMERERERMEREREREAERQRRQRDSLINSVIGTAGRTAASSITRGLLGGILGGSRRR